MDVMKGVRPPLRFLWIVLLMAARMVHSEELVEIPSPEAGIRLTGYWFAAPGSERRPAVIALQGCNGALDEHGQVSALNRREAGDFNSEAFHYWSSTALRHEE